MARLELGNIRGSFKTTKLKKNVRPKHKGSALHLRVNALEPPQEDQGSAVMLYIREGHVL